MSLGQLTARRSPSSRPLRRARTTLAIAILVVLWLGTLTGALFVLPVAHSESHHLEWDFVRSASVPTSNFSVNFSAFSTVEINWSQSSSPQGLTIQVTDSRGDVAFSASGFSGAGNLVAGPGNYAILVMAPAGIPSAIHLTLEYAFVSESPLL
jgi:hypothetical protein